MISYRDPQVRKTYEAYNQIPKVIGDIRLSRPALEQIIIGTYGTFDPHQSAAARGATGRNEYLCGITADQKQQRQAEIIATNQEDLRKFAERFQQMTENCHRAIIGNRAKIEADKSLFDSILEL
jgi:Zn-dependent M16 (insulinase) family peptidase